jgi:hypothetical protein
MRRCRMQRLVRHGSKNYCRMPAACERPTATHRLQAAERPSSAAPPHGRRRATRNAAMWRCRMQRLVRHGPKTMPPAKCPRMYDHNRPMSSCRTTKLSRTAARQTPSHPECRYAAVSDAAPCSAWTQKPCPLPAGCNRPTATHRHHAAERLSSAAAGLLRLPTWESRHAPPSACMFHSALNPRLRVPLIGESRRGLSVCCGTTTCCRLAPPRRA